MIRFREVIWRNLYRMATGKCCSVYHPHRLGVFEPDGTAHWVGWKVDLGDLR